MTAHEMIREPLPARRRAELVTLEVNGSPFYEVGIGRYDDGRLAEVFISCVRPTQRIGGSCPRRRCADFYSPTVWGSC